MAKAKAERSARQRAYDAYDEAVRDSADDVGTIPHCDARILHDPAECEYCNRPELQVARLACGIALTGHEPDEIRPHPCPADAAVQSGERGDYNEWPGNVAHRD